MPRFRPVDPRLAGVPFTLDGVRRLAAEAMAPRHFFVAPDLDLEWAHVPREEVSWEIFRGRLLDPAHTRERAVFEAWSVYEKTPASRERQRPEHREPLLSLKLDEAASVLYVVRGLECYVWEGYDSGGGVILSRERRKWVRELVATLRFDQLADLDELQDEIVCGLYHAVVGTSRLPLTAVEAPLPAFSFGRLLYWFREATTAAIWHELPRGILPRPVAGKLLQTYLLAVPLEKMKAAEFACFWGKGEGPLRLLEAMFNDVSLSPWTDLTKKVNAFLYALRDADLISAENVVEFLSGLLRKIGRHLTAYDLVTFHHRGANYPDALLLDAVFSAFPLHSGLNAEKLDDEEGDTESVRTTKAQVRLHFGPRLDDAEGDTEAVRKTKRRWRRGLRQAWLIRRQYEGHLFPDLPTSPGENNRVLPPSHPRVPEEQIAQTGCRTRRLFEFGQWTSNPTKRALTTLRQSVTDLAHPDELRELGVGIFLDRPLGTGKAPGEPDATPLLASLAFSRSIAIQRIRTLAKEELFIWQKGILDRALETLLEAPPRGLPLDRIGGASRPGAVSLADARLASPDFEFLETLPSSRAALLGLFDWSSVPVTDFRLVARDPAGEGLLLYDAQLRPRLQVEVAPERGFVCRAGVEYPAAGLLVTRLWEETEDGSLRERDLRGEPIRLPPR